ncbi:MAG: universal stress protein [Defluviicoccus sp.]|nr:MAG: universal stress protein [Defluviicoccus sp.]
MSYRKILVSVQAGNGARSALDSAFALAKEFGAHVEGLRARGTDGSGSYVGEGMSGALVQELVELTEQESAQRAPRARCSKKGVMLPVIPDADSPGTGGPSASWLEEMGREADAVVLAGRLADLIVVGRTGNEVHGSAPVLTAALFETGRPVLVAGKRAEGQNPTDRAGAPRWVVVAWNQSAEAARAVAGALPLLARAQRVTAVSVGDGDETARGLADLARYLAWHGINAETAVLSGHPSPSEALAAAGAGADLVVLGGYSHSRLRELILGGVTRHLLEKTSLPLLLAH